MKSCQRFDIYLKLFLLSCPDMIKFFCFSPSYPSYLLFTCLTLLN
ncbi:CLUMA_CG011049, isoform A [Clunio marinus]|uniref:CLUMA_CG011049, isoform A n=1 Tax=Clunio marinus TaxID=568069 RepID=A0A1J1IBQ8_9DIPT|nr:CLUMA_CG011049, isoform A [Clunio marinus]